MSNEKYTIELDIREIATLSVILDNIGGDPDNTIRCHADTIVEKVDNIFTPKTYCYDNDKMMQDDRNGIYFIEESVKIIDRMTGTTDNTALRALKKKHADILEKMRKLNLALETLQNEVAAIENKICRQ